MEITIIIVDTLIVLCILFMLATVVDIVKNVLRGTQGGKTCRE